MKNQKRVSEAEYGAFRKRVLEQTVFKQPVGLNDIHIVGRNRVEVKGGVLPMTDKAAKELFSIIGLPQSTSDELMSSIGNENTVSIANILKTIKQQKREAGATKTKSPNIAMVVDKGLGEIVGFTRTLKQILPNSIFIESLEQLMNNNKGLEIASASITSDGICVNMINPEWSFNVAGNKDEDFWGGLSYTSSHGGAAVDQYLERLVCENGMTYKSNASSLKCEDERLVGPFLRAVAVLRAVRAENFQARVSKFMNVNASIAELGMTARFMNEMTKGDKDHAKPLIKQLIPYEEVKEAFKKETGIRNIFHAPVEVQSQLISPKKYWQLINDVTYFATHYQRLTGSSLGALQTNTMMAHAGNMVNSNPDLYNPVKQLYGV
jgi:hypothetical protein